MINTKFKYIFLSALLCITPCTKASQIEKIMPNYSTIVQIIPNFEYQLIGYQTMLKEMVKKLLAKYIYEQKVKKEPINHIAEEIHVQIPSISRTQAMEMIKQITNKAFDPQDSMHISMHFEDMNNLTNHLDPQIDAKTIEAIKFLFENQHKTSVIHLPFWIQNIKTKDLQNAIPMSPEVATKSDIEKLKILQKKMAIPKPEAMVIA